MATCTYYIDRKVRYLGPNGPVEEPLLPDFVEKGPYFFHPTAQALFVSSVRLLNHHIDKMASRGMMPQGNIHPLTANQSLLHPESIRPGYHIPLAIHAPALKIPHHVVRRSVTVSAYWASIDQNDPVQVNQFLDAVRQAKDAMAHAIRKDLAAVVGTSVATYEVLTMHI
jgi:hypothetical protein